MHDEGVSCRQPASSKGNTCCASLGVPEVPELKGCTFSHGSKSLQEYEVAKLFVIFFHSGVDMVDNTVPDDSAANKA